MNRRVDLTSILFIVVKASNELDFLLPVILKLRQEYPGINLEVFYATIDKQKILKGSNYYYEVFKQQRVKQTDLFDKMNRSSFFVRCMDFCLNKVLSRKHIPLKLKNQLARFIERIFLSKRIFLNIQEQIKPNIIFIPLRSTDHIVSKKLSKYLSDTKVPLIFFPQGAFPSTGTYSIDCLPRDLGTSKIVDEAFIWYSFIEEETKELAPTQKEKFHYVGYPGLDEEWLNTRRVKGCSASKSVMTCLLIIRKFVSSNKDLWVFDDKEFKRLMAGIKDTFEKRDMEIRTIIKPHPSNDIDEVRRCFDLLGWKNYEITLEPIYAILDRCDFAVSVPSTVSLVPAMYGMPVIFLESSVKKTFEKWEPIKRLYCNLQFCAHNQVDISTVVGEVIAGIKKNDGNLKNKILKEKEYFRSFFPDESIELIMKSLQQIIDRKRQVA